MLIIDSLYHFRRTNETASYTRIKINMICENDDRVQCAKHMFVILNEDGKYETISA